MTSDDLAEAKREITQEYLMSILHYDPDTGVFRWRLRSDVPKEWNTRFANQTAGAKRSQGYIKIKINCREYLAHRLAWLYTFGYWPKHKIDHRGNGDDNRIGMLREATQRQNIYNQHRSSRNTSGFKGVGWNKQKGKWEAKIKADGRCIFLGAYDDPAIAHEAYKQAARQFHGAFANDGNGPIL